MANLTNGRQRSKTQSNDAMADLHDIIHALPKIELHRHLEGSLRLQTLYEIGQQHGIPVPPGGAEGLRPFVQVMPYEPRTWQNFMSKFGVLRQFFVSPQVIRRITREVVIDAAEDNVKYLELRFTPKALSNVVNCSPQQIIEWVCTVALETAADYDIQVKLIVSINRHESLDFAEEAVQAAMMYRNRGVVGVDLAGIEDGYSAYPFRDLFRRARHAGLGVTLHAGEWQGAESVWDAISNVGADRIGHGIRSLEDQGVMNVLLDNGIALEVCPSSNVDTGSHADLPSHPLPKLIQSGLPVSINTDDPLVFDVTLTDELVRSIQHMTLTLDDIKRQTIVAAQTAFLPQNERAALVGRFSDWLYPDGQG